MNFTEDTNKKTQAQLSDAPNVFNGANPNEYRNIVLDLLYTHQKYDAISKQAINRLPKYGCIGSMLI